MAVRRDDGHLLIEVRDDGIGLPLERERVLEPYMTTRTKGTGLGLAIVKKIVEYHGGRIWLDPDSEEGTAIHFTLPVLPGAPTGEPDLPTQETRKEVTA